MKGKNIKVVWDSLSDADRSHISQRSAELINEYETLQSLRQALELTQSDVANTLNVHQVSVSKIEKRNDLKLSTLRDYLSSLGGNLRIMVDFPGKQSITLKGFGEGEQPENA